MAEEENKKKKKIPKLPPKNTNAASTASKSTNPPKKPTTAPAKSTAAPADSTATTPQSKPTPLKKNATKASPKQSGNVTSTSSPKPKSAQAPPKKPTPAPSDAAPQRKPSLAPSKASTPTTKPAESPAPSTARKPSTASRAPSVPPPKASETPSGRKPSLAPRKPSTAAVKSTESASPSPVKKTSAASRKESTPAAKASDAAENAKPSKLPLEKSEDESSAPPPARRPSVPPRKASSSVNKATNADAKPKPPKLGPRKTDDQVPTSSSSKKPPLAQRKSSTSAAKPATAGTDEKNVEEEDGEISAHKVPDEDKDLKSFLSESERADLTLLIANIAETMRKTIESNFDAAATLKDLGPEGQSEEDKLANIDYDPGTVDVSQYDKENKAREEREKELATPKVKELKKNALQWFDDWREVVIQRVGEAVNSKETTSKQKEKASGQESKTTTTPITEGNPIQRIDTGAKQGEYRPPKLDQLFPRIQSPLTKLPMQKRILVLHSILLILLSLEHYNAASRVLLLYLTSSMKLGLKNLRDDEEKTAKGLLEAAKQIQADQGLLKRTSEESENSRKWKIRLAQIAGAAVVGLSGSMAAPMVSHSPQISWGLFLTDCDVNRWPQVLEA